MLVLDLGEVDMFATKNNEWVDRLTPAPQGEGGFDACWYPVAMSDEVAPGAFHRAEFLDGHVIVERTSTGEVSVLSPYCRHYGADLSDGDMENGCLIRCPLHHWKYDGSRSEESRVGKGCVSTVRSR